MPREQRGDRVEGDGFGLGGVLGQERGGEGQQGDQAEAEEGQANAASSRCAGIATLMTSSVIAMA